MSAGLQRPRAGDRHRGFRRQRPVALDPRREPTFQVRLPEANFPTLRRRDECARHATATERDAPRETARGVDRSRQLGFFPLV